MGSKYIPVCVSLKGSRVLVVGGGNVALRKIDHLLDYDTEVTVIAPEVVDKIRYYADSGKLTLESREYRSPEASQYRIVISACDDKSVNEAVFGDCVNSGTLVNIVDNPELCSFIFPAVVKRDHLTISVSTDGRAPFLSSYLRILLEDIFPTHWNKIARYAHVFRKMVQDRHDHDSEAKAACFERFLAADWKTIIKSKSKEEIERELEEML
jgi:siroheme synthase-like protein